MEAGRKNKNVWGRGRDERYSMSHNSKNEREDRVVREKEKIQAERWSCWRREAQLPAHAVLHEEEYESESSRE